MEVYLDGQKKSEQLAMASGILSYDSKPNGENRWNPIIFGGKKMVISFCWYGVWGYK